MSASLSGRITGVSGYPSMPVVEERRVDQPNAQLDAVEATETSSSALVESPRAPPQPFPPLPVELVRIILEFSASHQSPFQALQLLLVSRSVRRWLVPVIYRYVQWLWDHRVEERMSAFCRTVASPEAGVSRWVRGLVVYFSEGTEANVFAILRLCPSLDSITIFGHRSLKDMPVEEGCASPRHLCVAIPIDHQSLPPANHPFLASLRCLFVAYIIPADVPTILCLPRLTHCATYTLSSSSPSRGTQLSTDILRASSTIQSFIMLFKSLRTRAENDYTQEPWLSWARIADERFVVRAMFKGEFPTSVMSPCDMTFWTNSERLCRGWRRDVQEAIKAAEAAPV